jgi:hypothetical protein
MNFSCLIRSSKSCRETKWYSLPFSSPTLGFRLVSIVKQAIHVSYEKRKIQNHLDVLQKVSLIMLISHIQTVRKSQLDGNLVRKYLLNTQIYPASRKWMYRGNECWMCWSNFRYFRVYLGLMKAKKGVRRTCQEQQPFLFFVNHSFDYQLSFQCIPWISKQWWNLSWGFCSLWSLAWWWETLHRVRNDLWQCSNE